LRDRLERVHTPKHGSWLNIAEIELNVLARQCFCRMIGDQATLREQVAAGESHRNPKQKGMDWQFTTADARIKLKRLYQGFKTDGTLVSSGSAANLCSHMTLELRGAVNPRGRRERSPLAES
jgi:hypothetical protein